MSKYIFPLFLLLTLMGCSTNAPSVSEANTYDADLLSTDQIAYGPTSPHYSIEANYNETSHTISGTMDVTFTNNLKAPLTEIFFNFWPNANEFEESKATIQNVYVDGESVKVSLKEHTLAFQEISIPKNATSTATMDFQYAVPQQADRFGWHHRQVSLGNWFPILAVHDNHGWNTPPYFPYGEAFYSVTGDYEVTLSAPADLEILTTGQVQSRSETDGMQTIQATAENIRDFFLLLNSEFQTKEVQVGETTVSVSYREGEETSAQIALDTAEKVFPRYEEWFGTYPWDSLTIASVDYSPDFNGGMEYPKLVTVSTPYLQDEEEFGLTVAHEIAHQWFYNMIGSNSYREPWLDESLTTFASYSAYYGTTNFDWITETAKDYSITSSIADFAEEDGDRYEEIMYDGGARMLSELHNEMGDSQFWKAMRIYCKEYTFEIATTADFVRIVQKESETNLKPFFEEHSVFLSETFEEPS